MTYPLNGIAHLSHLGVIRVEGEDAAKFLHGQLTQDFALLDLQHARLSAFLSAKGRMQATFIGFKRSATEILLIGSRDLLPTTLKRLSMFVMRAKAKLSDASGDFALYGLAGDSATAALGRATAEPWTKIDLSTATSSATVVALYPADGQPRALWVAPVAEATPAGPALDPALWQWSEVRSAVATLTTPVFEAFVPQMLNYESVGGVNFKKGCYPGQEVVARSQFRGTLKRRAFVAHTDSTAAIAVGDEVFAPTDLEQPCGTVVAVAAHPAGGQDLIVSLQLSATEGPLQVGAAADGSAAALSLLPLPYELLADL
jgi:folate-binding protein YgfZ